ncbi:hypothetical protein [Pontibacter sp. SGAir0037]|uniref:hypothetical protein n=1 Tax=Pontibacter sp. SGAir0037 TaxID=2571030 RepID=UPI0010F83CD6|nr:hypothetical protein [Pontibacter sp. SGAir0037]
MIHQVNSKAAVIRFFLGMALLFGMAAYLIATGGADKAAWLVLAFGAIPVAAAGTRILRNARKKQA